MLEEILIAGFGGQGVMLLGQLLGGAAIEAGLNATWLPSYGPEMRGSTANCFVVISSDNIGSPLVEDATTFFCFNQPSLNKFADNLRPDTLLIINKNLVKQSLDGFTGKVLEIPAQEIARDLGNERMVNMVMLGAFMTLKPIITKDQVHAAIRTLAHFPEKVIEANMKAIEAGEKYASEK